MNLGEKLLELRKGKGTLTGGAGRADQKRPGRQSANAPKARRAENN